jgi:hypothetical protein
MVARGMTTLLAGKAVLSLQDSARGGNDPTSMVARAHSTRSGADTVIDLGAAAGRTAGEDVLTLTGMALATLDACDFLFT